MNIQEVPIESLVKDPNNARLHDAKNIEAIKGSLTSFGQVEPLVVQKNSRTVIGGNGRLEAMISLGYKSVKIFEVDLDDRKAKALALALNRTAELATWDWNILGQDLENLKNSDFDLSSIGFNEKIISEKLGEEIDESIADDVKKHECPKCGFQFA